MTQPINELEETYFLLQSRKTCVNILDTCLVRSGAPQSLFTSNNSVSRQPGNLQFDGSWPFGAEGDSGASPTVSRFLARRATEAAARIDTVINHFLKDVTDDGSVVALAMHPQARRGESGNSSIDVAVEHLTKDIFSEKVRLRQFSPGTVLAKYQPPASGKHNLVRVIFTPMALRVEKHESLYLIRDVSKTLSERFSIANGQTPHCRVASVSKEIEAEAYEFFSSLFAAFREDGATIYSAVGFFFEQSPSKLCFLWMSHMELRHASSDDGIELHCKPKSRQVQVSGNVISSDDHFLNFGGSIRLSHKILSNIPRGSRAPPSSPTATSEPIPFSELKDFGFYSNEKERIDNQLKRHIRSISRVELPKSLELDDTPPYDDQFIAALCDPTKAEEYFSQEQPHNFASFRRRRGTILQRNRSKSFRFVAADQGNSLIRAQSLRQSIASFRRRTSGCSEGGFSEYSVVSEQSIAFQDPQVSKILCDNFDDIDVTLLSSAVGRKNVEVVQQVLRTVPNPLHHGHIAELRRKYHSLEFVEEEDEAACRSSTRQQYIVSQMKSKCSTNKAQKKLVDSKQEQKPAWNFGQRLAEESKPPFQRLSRTPTSVTAHLVHQTIPQYEQQLANGSLLGYIVGTDRFEASPKRQPLDITQKDLVLTQRERLSRASGNVEVPDAPVTSLTNLHLSVSNEMMAQRRQSGNFKPSRDILEVLFGTYDVKRGQQNDLSTPTDTWLDASTSVVNSPMKFSPMFGGRMDDSVNGPFGTSTTFANTVANARLMQQMRHGQADAKKKVQQIVSIFEDLLYQWESNPSHFTVYSDLVPFVVKRQLIAFVIPPSFYELTSELRSLFLTLKFSETEVDVSKVESYSNLTSDDGLFDELPTRVSVFSIAFAMTTIPRLQAAARLFAVDVIKLFAEEKWDVIDRIRDMTESQGFTFVDAVVLCTKGEFLERSSVSTPMIGVM